MHKSIDGLIRSLRQEQRPVKRDQGLRTLSLEKAKLLLIVDALGHIINPVTHYELSKSKVPYGIQAC